MAPLSNPRHERFAQELAKGKSASEAYAAAGYKPNDGNCIRLKGNERVQERVAEIIGRAAERAVVTVESIIGELEGARSLAIDIKQPSAAVSASMGKAKVAGLLVDRAVHSGNVTVVVASDDANL